MYTYSLIVLSDACVSLYGCSCTSRNTDVVNPTIVYHSVHFKLQQILFMHNQEVFLKTFMRKKEEAMLHGNIMELFAGLP